MVSTQTARYRRFLEKLREFRLKAGLTQVQVCKALGYPQSYVSKCETGERRVDVVELQEFAKLYKRQVGDFLQ
jgi:transcriptional regulator with XRE-family HTH domain